MESKSELRRRIRSALQTISPAARATASAQACARLKQQVVWKKANTVFFYAPLPEELDLWPLLREAISSGKRVTLPRFVRETRAYAPFLIKDTGSDLVIGQLGIREPGPRCAQLPGDQIDLAMVPGVAFDTKGRRLGRGKGFYDQLLRTVQGTKCGVAFDEQIVGGLPVEPHDFPMQCILTPTRWIECG
jgi:5-formyltetrahydrofolate cyclo-ligase